MLPPRVKQHLAAIRMLFDWLVTGLTPRGRERIVRQVENGQTPEAVAEAAGVCPRTVRKWVDRYRREGLAGLQDRSSRPHRLHRPTPQAVIEKPVEAPHLASPC